MEAVHSPATTTTLTLRSHHDVICTCREPLPYMHCTTPQQTTPAASACVCVSDKKTKLLPLLTATPCLSAACRRTVPRLSRPLAGAEAQPHRP